MKRMLTISATPRFYHKQLYTKDSFFSEPVVYELKDDCIYFRHANLDDVKNVVNPYHRKDGYYQLFINIGDEIIENKRYEFEDDSDEDVVIIYLK